MPLVDVWLGPRWGQEDSPTVFYRVRVKQIACLSFWLNACCAFAIAILCFCIAAAVPTNETYQQVLEECQEGSIDRRTCEVLQQVFAQICESKQLSGEDCIRYVSDLSTNQVKNTLIGLGVAIAVAGTACNWVPLLGFCGAKRGNACCVGLFFVFNLLAAVNFILGRNGSLPFALVTFMLPAMSVYYAGAYLMRRGRPAGPAVGEPLLAQSPPLYPPPGGPQPVQAFQRPPGMPPPSAPPPPSR